MKKNNIQQKVTFTDSFSEAADLVISGDADALIGDEQIVLYHLYRNNKHDKLKTIGDPLFIGQCGMAVKDGNTIVLSIMQKGITHARESSAITKIYKKWLGAELQQNVNLWESYKGYIVTVVLIIVFLFISAWVWNNSLKKQVKTRTKELERLNSVLQNDIEQRERIEKELFESEEIGRASCRERV